MADEDRDERPVTLPLWLVEHLWSGYCGALELSECDIGILEEALIVQRAMQGQDG